MIQNIFIIGDVMLDRYIMGSVDRISPEAPVPVVRVLQEKVNLGGAGNVALNAAKLNAVTFLFGSIGKDTNGEILKTLLTKQKITSFLIEEDMPTISKTRIVGNNQQIVRFDYEKIKNLNTSLERLNLLLPDFKQSLFIISDYGKGLCSEALCQSIIKFSKDNNCQVIIDPKGLNWDKYQGAFLITPNLKELSEIWGSSLSNEDDTKISKVGEIIRKRFDLQHLLVTRSEKGMTLISEGEIMHVPTHAQSVYDVTGAGDTVIATLAVSLSRGGTLKYAIRRANYAAGIAVSKFGTYAVTLEDLKSWDEANSKISI